MKQAEFTFGDTSYHYYLVRQNRKTISLTVQPSQNIILKCPRHYSEEKITDFLRRKWYWLDKQLRYFQKYQKNPDQREYVSGESFLYLGRQYRLMVEQADVRSARLEAGKIILTTTGDVQNKYKNKRILEAWYNERAEQVFYERYKTQLKRFNYDFTPELDIRRMDKRWGSFLAQKKILLNPELIKAPKDCIDYVIMHELCHMKYKNHCHGFYRLLKSKCPDWEKVKEKLELRFL